MPKQVAKLVIIDDKNKYLLMYRSAGHPTFPVDDPDLPGGTVEEGESPLVTLLREVVEEAGIAINKDEVQEVYVGNEYSAHKTVYYLYIVRVSKRPDITMSWEHASYKWLDRDDFIKESGEAVDTYMRMVHDVLKPQ